MNTPASKPLFQTQLPAEINVGQTELASLDLSALNLNALLTTQISDRITAANAAKTQTLAAEPTLQQAAQKSGRTISSKQAISIAADAQDLIAEQTATPESPPPAPTEDLPPLLNEIRGTQQADDLTGTDGADAIKGLRGNDKLRGDNGNDVVSGQAGDDIISGDHVPDRTTQSDDKLYGNSGNDKLFGRIGDDRLFGGGDDDQLFGGSGSDRLIGGYGNDQLFGGIVEGDLTFNPDPDGRDVMVGGDGNDYLEGGIGNDYLDGSNPRFRGIGELDLLVGGEGQDTFVLGHRNGVYYTQGGASQDFGVIIDFEQGDRVRLNGDASQYVLGYDAESDSTAIGYLGSGSFELIGVFADQDLSGMSLSDSTFRYVV